MGAPQDQPPDLDAGRRVHVLHVLEATAGGTRRHLRDLVGGLDPLRFRVSVAVSLRRDADFARDIAHFRAQGVAVHLVDMQRRPAPLQDLLSGLRLLRLCCRIRPDVVHAHSSKAGFLGRCAAHAARIRVTVYTPHAFAWDTTAGAWARRAFRMLERLAVPWTDRLIAVSRHERQLALTLGFAPEQVVLVPNGVPTGVDPAVARRRRAHVAGDGVVVGFAGRLSPQKAPDLFLSAVPRILAELPEARFLMVAEAGPWDARVRRAVARHAWRERVSWGTAHDESGVAAHLARMDVLLMPSRWEGLPYTLLEAMDAGVPVVASAVGGITDVLTDGVDGLLVPVDDAGALAGGAVRLLRDDGLRERLTAAAAQRVRAFGLDAMLARTAAVYLDAMAGNAPAGWARRTCRTGLPKGR
jgi:glycosyltransferase involved in cell wall biosynthesis